MLATRQPLMHTEYLQPLDPLPTTLDAKKSPLALLAQTCSSIGKPDPPSSNDFKSSRTSPLDTGKMSPAERLASIYDKPSFKPYKQAELKDGDATILKIGYPRPPKTASPQTGGSAPARPSSRDHHKSTSAPTSPVAVVKPKTESIPPAARSPPMGSPASVNGHCGDHRSSVPKHSAPLPAQTAPHVITSVPSLSASYKSGLNPPTSSSGHGCGCSSGPSQSIGHLPYLSEHHHHAAHHKHDSGNPLVAATAHSPYAAAYARVKTADGGTTLMPICRDPYCNNCQSAQVAAAATNHCTQSSGCTQCRHDSVASLSAGAFPVALPVAGALPYIPTSLASAFPGSPYFYPHAAIPPSSAQSEHGHVCNWVSGSTSCGKRFASSEELLQHLRTHTMSSSEVSNASALSASLNAQLSAYYMQYPGAMASPLGFAKSPFHASAMSPGSATAPIRYHPYKTSAPITALPGLPAGYYPYSLHDLKARFPTGVPH